MEIHEIQNWKNLIEQIGFSDVIASLPIIDKCYVSLSS